VWATSSYEERDVRGIYRLLKKSRCARIFCGGPVEPPLGPVQSPLADCQFVCQSDWQIAGQSDQIDLTLVEPALGGRFNDLGVS
jgi:hypothetical protein